MSGKSTTLGGCRSKKMDYSSNAQDRFFSRYDIAFEADPVFFGFSTIKRKIFQNFYKELLDFNASEQ
jgi:hypothetical protein